MKTAIIYYSKHHSNTKQLLDAIGKNYDVDLINASDTELRDLSGYDLIGFASGIYYSKFHKLVTGFAERNLPQGKNTFLIYTCAAVKDGYTQTIENALKSKGAKILGTYCCYGYDTFGPFKLVGGVKKGHPDKDEIGAAVSFYEGLTDVVR